MSTKLDPIFNHGRAVGRGGGLKRQGGPGGEHGRSEWSPGHQKQADGARSARDYAPGRTDKPDSSDRRGRDAVLPEGAPEEQAED
jgi:hypothetical protein